MAKSRDAMINEIESRYGRPAGLKTLQSRLGDMDPEKLRSLHASLVSLSDRGDMKRTPTAATRSKREAANARFLAAVGRLKELRAKSMEAVAKRDLVHTPGSTVISAEVVRAPTGLDILQASSGADADLVTQEVFAILAEDLKEKVTAQLLDSVEHSSVALDHLVETAMSMDLKELMRTQYEASSLLYAQAVHLRLYREAVGLVDNQAYADVLNRLVHLTYLKSEQEPLVLSALDRTLPAFKAPELLRKLMAFVGVFKPDVLYAPDAGSRAVAEFLAAECKTVWKFDTSIWQSRKTMPIAVHVRRTPRILFIRDVAEDVVAYRRFRRRAMKDHGAHVGFAALVSSADVRTTLHDNANTCIAALAFEKGYDLPWSRVGHYRRDPTGHIFGADTAKRLHIPDAFLDWPDAVQELAESEPPEPA